MTAATQIRSVRAARERSGALGCLVGMPYGAPALAAFLIVVTAALGGSSQARAESEAPCKTAPDDVIIDAGSRTLFLCKGGRAAASYPINLGQGGVGKRVQGDQKTPLGRYRLSPPRASVSGFTWFVPIGYPTAAQKKLGYTGGAIGIHGPPDWLPQLVVDVAFDTPWTDGCVMVRTREEIDAIRAWLLQHKPRWVTILEPKEEAQPPVSGRAPAALN